MARHQLDVEQLLDALFSDGSPTRPSSSLWTVSPVPPGLKHMAHWLPGAAQDALKQQILASGALRDSSNQAMFFGNLPAWAHDLIRSLPADTLAGTLASREPLFNQIIVNRYLPGEGITDHVDLARFQDGIVSVSLGGPVVMHFTPVNDDTQAPVEVLLEGGDLLVMTGPARYHWKHGIRSVLQEVHQPSGRLVVREERISVTLRRMCEDIVLTEPA